MTQWETLVSLLDQEDFLLLKQAIWDRHRKEIQEEAQNFHLTEDEVEFFLSSGQKVDTIIRVKNRLDCSIELAKAIFELRQEEITSVSNG